MGRIDIKGAASITISTPCKGNITDLPDGNSLPLASGAGKK